MDIKGKVIVVTGAASGIGRALCERFVRESASAVVVSDIDSVGMAETVALLGDDLLSTGPPLPQGSLLSDLSSLSARAIDPFSCCCKQYV